MRSDSIVFAIAGMCFGIILGWVIGTQQAARRGATAVQLQQSAPAPAPAATGAPAAGTTRQPPPLDEGKVQSLQTIINTIPAHVVRYRADGTPEFINQTFSLPTRTSTPSGTPMRSSGTKKV